MVAILAAWKPLKRAVRFPTLPPFRSDVAQRGRGAELANTRQHHAHAGNVSNSNHLCGSVVRRPPRRVLLTALCSTVTPAVSVETGNKPAKATVRRSEALTR